MTFLCFVINSPSFSLECIDFAFSLKTQSSKQSKITLDYYGLINFKYIKNLHYIPKYEVAAYLRLSGPINQASQLMLLARRDESLQRWNPRCRSVEVLLAKADT